MLQLPAVIPWFIMSPLLGSSSSLFPSQGLLKSPWKPVLVLNLCLVACFWGTQTEGVVNPEYSIRCFKDDEHLMGFTIFCEEIHMWGTAWERISERYTKCSENLKIRQRLAPWKPKKIHEKENTIILFYMPQLCIKFIRTKKLNTDVTKIMLQTYQKNERTEVCEK